MKRLNKTQHSWLWFGGVLLLLSLGQLQRWQITPNLPIYGHEVLMAGLVLSAYCRRAGEILAKLGRIKLLQVTLIWIALGWLLNSVWLEPGLRLARLGLYLAWGKWLYDRRHLLRSQALLAWGGLVWWFGMLQYAFMPDTRFLAILGWDDHLHRLISTQFDPNFTGLLLVLTIIVWTGWTMSPKKFWWRLLGQLALVAALALTYSRASFLSLGIGLSGIFLLETANLKLTRKLWYLAPIIWLVMAIQLLPITDSEGTKLNRSASVSARVVGSQTMLSSLTGPQLVWGQGLFSSPRARETTMPNHARLPNDLPTLLFTQTGLVGILIAGVWLRWIWIHQPQALFRASLVAVLTHSLFNQSLFQPFILSWLVILGTLTVPTRKSKNEN